METLQQSAGLVTKAGASVIETGVIGALLVLSIFGNVALIFALVRCYKNRVGANDDV